MATVNNWIQLAGRSYIDVTIAAEATVSDIIALGNRVLVGLQFDSDFAGSAVTLQSGGADDNLADYYFNSGTALSLTVSASRYVGLKFEDLFPLTGFVKLTSGSAQGAGTPTTIRVFAVDMSK